MKKLLTLCVFLVACGGDPREIYSNCGMILAPQPTQEAYWFTSWTQEDLQQAEDAAMLAFSSIQHDWRFSESCSRVAGYRVVIRPEKYWLNLDLKTVSGETPCLIKTMYINADTWRQSSLIHEMAHAVQNCEPRKPWVVNDLTDNDFYHQYWLEDGIYDSIWEASQL